MNEATRLIGRETELAALETALAELLASRGGVVQVSGDPGIGKSRLLAELRARAEAARVTSFAGRAAEFEQELPFGAFVSALDDLVATMGDELVDALGAGYAAELGAVFPSLAGRMAFDTGRPAAERFRAHRAVRALLAHLAQQRPLLLVLDDLHWADPATVELVGHLLLNPPEAPVLLALARRPGQSPAALVAITERALSEGELRDVALAPLALDDARELVGDDVAPGVREEICRDSRGNPFYLLALARSARRATGALPAGVAAAIAEEVGLLTDAPARLLRGAAVAGDPFVLDLAEQVAGLAPDAGFGAVDVLVERGLIAPTETPRRFRFRHPILRRAVYDSLPAGSALAMHARAVEVLREGGASASALAHHIERCAAVGDTEAITTLAAAAAAQSARAPATAARWYGAALRLVPPGPEQLLPRLGLLVPLAVTLVGAGELEQGRKAIIEALEHLPVEVRDVRVRLIGACASVEHLLGRHEQARARLHAALDELDDGHPSERAQLFVELAADGLYANDAQRAQRYARDAWQLTQDLDDNGLRIAATSLLAWSCYCLAQADEGYERAREAAALFDAADDAELAARPEVPSYLAWAEFFLDHHDEALRHFERGLDIARSSGHSQFFAHMLTGTAATLNRVGRLPEALTFAQAGVDAARLSANSQAFSLALFIQGWLAAVAGERELALSACLEAVDVSRLLDDSVLSHSAQTVGGWVFLELGERDRGHALLDESGIPDLPLVEQPRRIMIYEALARAAIGEDDAQAAARWARHAEDASPGCPPAMRATACRTRAAVALHAGDHAAAAELGAEAGVLAREAGATVDAARADIVAGAAAAAGGDRPRALELLLAAEAALSTAGAERFRDEAVRALRKLGRRVRGRPAHGDRDALTTREAEIATLVTAGKTNRQIGDELYLSARTVETHLANISSKLGVSGRAAVAAVVTRMADDARE